MLAGKRVLVCALDWGLGHAARIVPMVAQLEALGADVVVASAGRALHLLRAACPRQLCLEMPAYNVRYFFRNMYLNMGLQAGSIFRAIAAEHNWLRHIRHAHALDVVLSDNRYGCWLPDLPCYFITHQLNIQLQGGPLQNTVNQLQQQWLMRFEGLWVPDYAEDGYQLAGRLAHGSIVRQPSYIGWLSRMKPSTETVDNPRGPIVALLSGPEPARSRWEKELLEQLSRSGLSAWLLRGVAGKNERYRLGNVQVVDYLGGSELQDLLASARLLICRSGYSTLTDLATMGQRAILVPTPGQTEQIYLADYCAAQRWAPAYAQQSFHLHKALDEAAGYAGFPLPPANAQGILPAHLSRVLQ